MGWWLQPEVWLVGQAAFWSLVIMTDRTRKANIEAQKKQQQRKRNYANRS